MSPRRIASTSTSRVGRLMIPSAKETRAADDDKLELGSQRLELLGKSREHYISTSDGDELHTGCLPSRIEIVNILIRDGPGGPRSQVVGDVGGADARERQGEPFRRTSRRRRKRRRVFEGLTS